MIAVIVFELIKKIDLARFEQSEEYKEFVQKYSPNIEKNNNELRRITNKFCSHFKVNLKNTHNCSLQVCNSADANRVKYLVKYFHINNDANSINIIREYIKVLKDREVIYGNLGNLCSSRNILFALSTKLQLQQPSYIQFNFLYISPAGRSSRDVPITLSIANLIKLERYLNPNQQEPTSTQTTYEAETVSYTPQATPHEFTVVSTDELNTVPSITGVYVLKNLTNRKVYVGQASSLQRRLNAHFSGKGNADVFQDYYNKHQFQVEYIGINKSGVESIHELESMYIKFYNSNLKGYNKTKGNRK